MNTEEFDNFTVEVCVRNTDIMGNTRQSSSKFCVVPKNLETANHQTVIEHYTSVIKALSDAYSDMCQYLRENANNED